VTRRFSLFLTAAALVFATHAQGAPAAKPQLGAENQDVDPKTGDFVFTGHAHFTWVDNTGAQSLVIADEIRYNPKGKVATAKGHVSVTRGPQRLLSDTLVYNFDEQKLVVENARLGEYPLYISAVKIVASRNQVVADRAKLSYSEPDAIAPSITAGKLTYVPNQTVVAEQARIGIGTTVPISLSRIQQKVDEPIVSTVDLEVGYRSSLGASVGVGALAPVYDGVKIGGNAAIYTSRGLLIGPAGNYDLNWGDQQIFGSFRSGYIHDYGERLDDVIDRPIDSNRGYFEWNHHQDVNENVTFFGQVRYWSDSAVTRDFIPDEFYRTQTPDTFFEGNYTANNYVVSFFTRVDPNDFAIVQQRLPELRFDLVPSQIGLGIYQRLEMSAAVLRQSAILDQPALSSTRFDAFYGLERPFTPEKWFTFTPVVGSRLTYYAHSVDDRSDYTRALGEVGFDANLLMSGVYDIQSAQWDIDGIRHILIPKVSYRYTPDADKGQAYIPEIDRTVFTTYLQPLELGDQRNIDQLHASNTLRFELDNDFQTRDHHYGSRDLFTFNIAADLEFHREAGQHTFAVVQTEAAFMPADWVRIDFYNNIDPNNFSVNEMNTGIRILDSDRWSVRFSNRYLARQIQEYVIDGRYRFNEAYQGFTRIDFDALQNRFVERTFGVRQNIRNRWAIDYAVSLYSGRARESDFGLSLRLILIGL